MRKDIDMYKICFIKPKTKKGQIIRREVYVYGLFYIDFDTSCIKLNSTSAVILMLKNLNIASKSLP